MSETAPEARPRTSAGDARTRLSREMSEFLLDLSIGAHRYAMYPAGHPSLGPVVENVVRRLNAVLAGGRTSLAIGVAGKRLVIGGSASEASHPVLGDLARRLHEHHIAALAFERGASPPEIEELLVALAVDPTRGGEPIGLLPPERLPTWDHVRIVPVGYEKLTLQDRPVDEATDPTETLWLELARAALASDEHPGEDVASDVAELARNIRERGRHAGYDEVIVGYMRQLAGELRRRDSGEALEVRKRLTRLIGALDDETLSRLVQLAASRREGKEFLLDMSHGLAVDAVVKLLETAAEAEGESISTSLTRMLTKLAVHAEGDGLRSRPADSALRDTVEDLIGGWFLDDPNPGQYTVLLDAMASASPLFARPAGGDPEDAPPGPERIVQMALEIDVWGETVERAVLEMVDGGRSRTLLRFVEEADEGSGVAHRIRHRLVEARALLQMLSEAEADEDRLVRFIEGTGTAAIDPLLEVLAESDSRSVRRKVFDALGRLGPTVAERAVERLDDPRWFVVRNMLALLGRLESVPEGVDLARFTRHEDARVRRQAFGLAVRRGPLRAPTLASALGEEDERLVRMALLELREDMPGALVPTVVERVLTEARPPEIRAIAVRLLRGSDSALVRDALLELASGGRSLLGRVRVADPAADVLAAVAALAGGWADDPDVRPLLAAARRSKDDSVRSAVEGRA